MDNSTLKKKYGASYKTGLVLLAVFAAISVLGFVFYGELYGEGGWCDADPNRGDLVNKLISLIPPLVRCIQVLFIALVVLYVVCTVIDKIFRGTPRRVTIGKLVNSIIKVVIWVVAVICILAVWGINVTALVAGAGVLTLVIGLGMQSLIADVVAGIFIVCDGTLQVGDIVTIDGWRGTVQEIGIRNTKLINYSGDIRIANNSTIKVFINQSRELSYPIVYIGIAYDEDLERVEKILSDNKDCLKERLPRVVEGPDYLGVNALADSSVILQFGAKCKEEDFFQVQRDMNREIRLLFAEENVHIPFPQVDVHYPDQEEKPQTK